MLGKIGDVTSKLILIETKQIQMEDQKKKFLLTKIKKEEVLIQTEYSHFRSMYRSKTIQQSRVESYFSLINHLVSLNNNFAVDLIEYLDKEQTKAVFDRFNDIFEDLLVRYKKCSVELKDSEEGKNNKQVREVCQICQQKIENNRIQKIKIQIETESETRSILIKHLIEQTEKQRVKPLFTEQEDRKFKEELEKLLGEKERALETNIYESSVFLEKISNQMANFMTEFRSDFSTWSTEPVQEHMNWSKMLKTYVNKKLANSFQQKIPSWIKKMHDMFVSKQPIIVKIENSHRSTQTVDLPSSMELKAKRETQQWKSKCSTKNQLLIHIQVELDKIKAQYNELKKKNHDLQIQIVKERGFKKLEKNAIKLKQSKSQQIQQHKSNISTIKELGTSNLLSYRELSRNPIEAIIQGKKKIRKMNSNQDSSKQSCNGLNALSIAQEHYKRSRKSIKIDQDECRQSENVRFSVNTNEAYREEDGKSKHQQPSANATPKILKKKGVNREKIVGLGTKDDSTRQGKILNDRQGSGIKYNNVLKNEIPDVRGEKLLGQQLNKNYLISILQSKKSQLRRYNSISVPKEAYEGLRFQNSYQKQGTVDGSLIVNGCQKATQTQQNHQFITQPSNNIKRPYKADINRQKSDKEYHINQQVINQELANIKDKLQNLSNRSHLLTTQQLSAFSQLIQRYINDSADFLQKQQAKQPIKSYSKQPRLSQTKQLRPYYQSKSVQKLPRISRMNKSLLVSDSFEAQQRRNKSLHASLQASRKFIEKQDNLACAPKMSLQQAQHLSELRSHQLTSELGQQFNKLFLNDQQARSYEISFFDKSSKRQIKPTASQFEQIEEMFQALELIKRDKQPLYLKICSFLKYPSTQMKSNFIGVNVAHTITYQRFVKYMEKILWIHRNCPKSKERECCGHLDMLTIKLKRLTSMKGRIV